MPPKPVFRVVLKDRRGQVIEEHEAVTWEEALKIELAIKQAQKELPRRRRGRVSIERITPE